MSHDISDIDISALPDAIEVRRKPVCFFAQAVSPTRTRLFTLAPPSAQRGQEHISVDLSLAKHQDLPSSVVQRSMASHPDDPRIVYRPTPVHPAIKLSHAAEAWLLNGDGELERHTGMAGDYAIAIPGIGNAIVSATAFALGWAPNSSNGLHSLLPQVTVTQVPSTPLSLAL